MENSITQITSHFFLFSFAFGTQLFSPLVDSKLTGVGFYKLGIAIVISTLVFALGIDFFMSPSLSSLEVGLYFGLIFLNGITYVFHKDKKSWPMWISYIFQVLLFFYLSFLIFNFNPIWISFFALSMTYLGISNFAMILGHYYLVVPKLSEEPLIYCLNLFWIVIFLKLMHSLSNLWMIAPSYLVEGTTLGDGYLYNWLFIIMRYVWGYLAPLVLSFFTYRLCKIRSIQSATGVLYIVEFFVIVGELISVYLMSKHGINL